MIPKIIHFCWLSNDPIPEKLQRCMDSWKKHLSDYEFMLWNFDRFPQGKSKWVDDAFNNKKYAFAADYIRMYALYNYGGIYLDMDVEVLKSFDDFLGLRTMICYENHKELSNLEVAAFGVELNSKWVEDCLKYYDSREFVNEDGSFNTKVLPVIVAEQLKNAGYRTKLVKSISEAKEIEKSNTIPVFDFVYFSPKCYETGEMSVASSTYSIHHFAGSWLPKQELMIGNIRSWAVKKIPWAVSFFKRLKSLF
mgnify:CR=1 FL=1